MPERSYRPKREGVDVWVPQYCDSNGDQIWWNDYWENGRRVKFGTREDAQAYLDERKQVDQTPAS